MTEARETHARILEKAEQLMLERGYSRVTMDELASSLRMSKKTLYRFFSSKEMLGEAVLSSSFARLGQEQAAILQDTRLDFSEKLRRFVQLLTGRYGRAATVLRDIQREAPSLWQRLLELRREAVQLRFGALLSEGVRAGAFRPDVEPRLVIRVLLTVVDQMMRPEVLEELEMSPPEVFSGILGVVLEGIHTRPERNSPQGRVPEARFGSA